MKLIDIVVVTSFAALISTQSDPSFALERAAIQFMRDEIYCTLLPRPTFDRKVRLSKPSREARKSVEWLSDHVGIRPNFEVMAGKFEAGQSPMAFAAIHDKTRFIVYDVELMFQSAKNTMTWRDLGIMAHELGHHISGATTLGSKSPHEGELEADRAAGHMLRLLGANIDQAISITAMFSEAGSLTHPTREQREEAVIEGWENAQGLIEAAR